jgi:hypothetical protein
MTFMTTFVGMTPSCSRFRACHLAVGLLVIGTCGTVGGSQPVLLKNLGFQAGPVWRTGAGSPGFGWEISLDQFVRTHAPYRYQRRWYYIGVGIGRQDGLDDRSAISSLRLSISPFQQQLDRRWRFLALASVRLNHWSTPAGGTDCILPEIGFQIMQTRTLFSPKLGLNYGREWRIGGAVEQPVAPATSQTFTLQAGISLNLGELRYLKRSKRRAEQNANP